MSENELDDERGESYLEIQMDRSTIVLAVVGILVLLCGAFLLGSWFGSRSHGDDAARAAADEAPADESITAGHDAEPVQSEDGFGGKPVSAAGAPPVRGVPAPAPRATAAVPAPPGPNDPAIVEEDVTAPSSATARAAASKPSSAKATAPKATAAKATAAKATAAKATAAKATAAAPKPSAPASTAAAGSGWVIQVAAVKEQREAEQLATRLRKKGYPVNIVNEGGFAKVHVGPYDSKSAAQAAEQRLKREEKMGTWLKRG